MEEKPEPPQREPTLLEQLTRGSKHNADFEREMERQFMKGKSSLKALSALTNPPQAHGSSASALASAKAALSEQLLGKSHSHSSGSKSQSETSSSNKNEQHSILEQAAAIRQDLKKWLDEHPEFVAANPTLAAAAAAAMAFNPPTISSSIPANVISYADLITERIA